MKEAESISKYTLDEAVDDGVLVKLFPVENYKKQFVVTSHLFNEIPKPDILRIIGRFWDWKDKIEATLKEEDRVFTEFYKGKKVWIIEDQQAFTLMYPEDY